MRIGLAVAALLFWTSSLRAGPAYVDVLIAVDIAAGSVVGRSISPTGEETPLAVTRPRRGQTKVPLDGYIGPDSALLPADSGWLPDLPPHAAGWRVVVATAPGFIAVPFPGGKVEQTADGDGRSVFYLQANDPVGPLVVGRYAMAERIVGKVKIRTFFTEANAALEDDYLQAAGEAVTSLASRIGDYPYEAFSVVESPLPVGLGFPGFTLVSGRILPLPFMRGRSLWHEVSHVWWGNGVQVDYDNGNWAEGFATFFADYALEEERGALDAKRMRHDWLLEFDALPRLEKIPLQRFVTKSHGQAQAVGYGRAAMLLVALKDRLGREVFDAGIRRFWKDNRQTRAGWRQIETAFSTESGQDLSAFFQSQLSKPEAAPVDPDDKDFRTFRALAESEKIQTLRMALSADSLKLEMLTGAPGAEASVTRALRALGNVSSEGFPILVGSRAALNAATQRQPPFTGPAIWATQDKNGRDVVAILATDIDTLTSLARRARHYGRWSWFATPPNRNASRGRWALPSDKE
ncbi:MAG: M1 family aminopeptidase [Alphaproteobacteria bacterium]